MTFHKNATLKVFSSSDEDGSYTYSCFAKEFAPKKHAIKWQKDGEDITGKAELFTTVSEPIKMNGNNVFNAASFLTVNTSDVGDEPQISCLFEGGQNQFLNQSVTYITKPPGEYLVLFLSKEMNVYFSTWLSKTLYSITVHCFFP